MPATKIECTICAKKFLASRKDTLYCSSKCRTRLRQENANFETPVIPRSGVPGVTYAKVRKRWEVRITTEHGEKSKYVG
jgi:hypothetical protein